MIRANIKNLRNKKNELMNSWKIGESEFKAFVELATKKSWISFHQYGHDSFAKRDYIEAISKCLNGYGAESLYPELPDVHYVNMGPYATTIILKGDKLYIGCWGDIFEKYMLDNPEEFQD